MKTVDSLKLVDKVVSTEKCFLVEESSNGNYGFIGTCRQSLYHQKEHFKVEESLNGNCGSIEACRQSLYHQKKTF